MRGKLKSPYLMALQEIKLAIFIKYRIFLPKNRIFNAGEKHLSIRQEQHLPDWTTLNYIFYSVYNATSYFCCDGTMCVSDVYKR